MTYSIVAEHAAIAIERADTVVVAAKELAEESGADVVEVWLDPSKALAGKGLSLALARYAVGGGGLSGDQNWKWEVRVSDQIISKQECRIEEAWWNHRDSFQKDGGGTDETALKKYISETFGVPFESVTPLWVERNITYGVTEK